MTQANRTVKSHKGMSSADILEEAGNDPEIVAVLIKSSETSLSALKHNIQTKSGLDVFDCILEDMQQRRQRASELKNLNVIMETPCMLQHGSMKK